MSALKVIDIFSDPSVSLVSAEKQAIERIGFKSGRWKIAGCRKDAKVSLLVD